MQIKPNQYFDPATSPFEVLGFFQEFIAEDGTKVFGVRPLECDEAPCLLGSPGRQLLTLTEDLHIQRPNAKRTPVVVKASSEFPVRVWCITNLVCGPAKHQFKQMTEAEHNRFSKGRW